MPDTSTGLLELFAGCFGTHGVCFTAQVTGMQGSDIPAAGEETTVEDLLRVVKQLPPDAEAARVCADFYMSSSFHGSALDVQPAVLPQLCSPVQEASCCRSHYLNI